MKRFVDVEIKNEDNSLIYCDMEEATHVYYHDEKRGVHHYILNHSLSCDISNLTFREVQEHIQRGAKFCKFEKNDPVVEIKMDKLTAKFLMTLLG